MLHNDRFMIAFARAPTMTKLAILARVAVRGQQSLTAVSRLLGLIVLMASMLDAESRIAISQQLRDEADSLCPPHDRRRLH
jgi:hypothetical protein